MSANQPQSAVSQSRLESLRRAISGQSLTNLPAIFQGFAAMGIPEAEIKPRENIFTYQAWKVAGRQVRRGEHGVRIVTFIESIVGFHAFRHGIGAALANRGVSPKTVQQILRHTDINTTFHYYVHSDIGAQREGLATMSIGTNVPIGTNPAS